MKNHQNSEELAERKKFMLQFNLQAINDVATFYKMSEYFLINHLTIKKYTTIQNYLPKDGLLPPPEHFTPDRFSGAFEQLKRSSIYIDTLSKHNNRYRE